MPARKRSFYTMKEACERIGVSRHTLLRWFGEGRVAEVPRSRRNRYRQFREEDIERIRAYAEALDLPEKEHKRQGRLFDV
jgi:excisionase family DNA binding protein